MVLKSNNIFLGDCTQVLKNTCSFPDSSIQLVVTSPPYSDRRKNSYGGPKPSEYVDWFLPIVKELQRILKPEGSLVLNIKEHVENGERLTYVLELILAMKELGWRWVEEYCWYKKTSFPGKWPNRFRDSWERCLHFTKQKEFYMDQDSVRVPIGDWSKSRFKSMSESDYIRYVSNNNEHMGRKVSNWLDRQTVYPHNVIVLDKEHYIDTTNVLEICPVTKDKNHSACYPIELPTWFIKLFSKEGDVVLDPFIGIGTTALASILLRRKYIGIELKEEYKLIAEANIRELQKKINS